MWKEWNYEKWLEANFVIKKCLREKQNSLTTFDVDMPKSFGFVLCIIHHVWNFRIDEWSKDFGFDQNIERNYICII